MGEPGSRPPRIEVSRLTVPPMSTRSAANCRMGRSTSSTTIRAATKRRRPSGVFASAFGKTGKASTSCRPRSVDRPGRRADDTPVSSCPVKLGPRAAEVAGSGLWGRGMGAEVRTSDLDVRRDCQGSGHACPLANDSPIQARQRGGALHGGRHLRNLRQPGPFFSFSRSTTGVGNSKAAAGARRGCSTAAFACCSTVGYLH